MLCSPTHARHPLHLPTLLPAQPLPTAAARRRQPCVCGHHGIHQRLNGPACCALRRRGMWRPRRRGGRGLAAHLRTGERRGGACQDGRVGTETSAELCTCSRLRHPPNPPAHRPSIPSSLLPRCRVRLTNHTALTHLRAHLTPPLTRAPPPPPPPPAQPIRRVRLYEPEADRVVTRAPGFRTIRGVEEEDQMDASLLSSTL